MTDPERPHRMRTKPETMRPIPDGGLQQSMPEWLRRPPAWRNLPKREEPEEAVPAAASVAVEERGQPEHLHEQVPAPLREPDTSEIDPRSLVDIGDLPRWLQDLAARSGERSAPPVTTDEPGPDATEDYTMREPENRADETGTEKVRDVAFEPVDKKKWAIPDEETKVYGSPKPTGMSWQVMLLIGVIAVVVIALLLMLIL